MNWLRANRFSVKDPLQTASYNDTNLVKPSNSQAKSFKNNNNPNADKIRSNPSFSLQKISAKVTDNQYPLTNVIKRKDVFKLPSLKKNSLTDFNP